MANDIHMLGGQIMCSSSREAVMYQSSHAHSGTPLALSLIADTVLNPAFQHDELMAQHDAASYEIREISSKPEMFIPEVVHNVAYNNTGLGNPLLCPEERISAMNDALLRSTMQDWYRPERMVIAGAGMSHEQLVELTDKYFSSLKASPAVEDAVSPLSRLGGGTSSANPSAPPHILNPTSPGLTKPFTRAASYLFPQSQSTGRAAQSPTSTYTGGHRFIHDPKQELDHLYIAFEGVGINDDDVYTMAVMQVLLGGGGSFSAGAYSSCLASVISPHSH